MRLLALAILSISLAISLAACTMGELKTPEFSSRYFQKEKPPLLTEPEPHGRFARPSGAGSLIAKSFIWPVPSSAHYTRGFKLTGHRHLGIDLAGAKGSNIFAAHQGRVIYVGHEFTDYGNIVMIESDNGWASFYAHCQKILVREGETIKKGQTIALMGETGNARGVHLHFELRRNKVPVDPLKYLPLFT